jgi:CBS domain-containing protein
MADTVTVREVMSANVRTLGSDDKVEDAADVMAEMDVSTLPVVSGDGTLLGVLRDGDLIASEARVHVPTFINFLGLGVPFPGEMKHLEAELKKIAGATVGDVMTSEPTTINADAAIEDAATIMHDEGINSIPVVDASNKVVGIIARTDLVRHIARTT